MVAQIVDARNPLLFYCEDLEKYVKEVDEKKINLLIVNKSDFLTIRQRLAWFRYFEKKNIKVVFWSAAIAIIEEESISDVKIDAHSQVLEEISESESEESEFDNFTTNALNKFNILSDEKNDSSNSDQEDSTQYDKDLDIKNPINYCEKKVNTEPAFEAETNVKSKKQPTESIINNQKIISENKNQNCNEIQMSDKEEENCKIFNTIELIKLFKTIHQHIIDKAKPGFTTIGLVGYPNVGKSSTLNALLQNKKVAVSETPGKTKHYQTFFLDDDLILCDCPGLVFPSFVSTRGELITNGILSIDQMRDYIEPINIVIQNIPKNVIEMIYGIEIKSSKERENSNFIPTAEEFCSSYSRNKYFFINF